MMISLERRDNRFDVASVSVSYGTVFSSIRLAEQNSTLTLLAPCRPRLEFWVIRQIAL